MRTPSTPRSRSPGTISDRKGVNLPNLVLPLSPMTPKDHRDLTFGLSLGVDWVALVLRAARHDIAELKKLVAGRAAVMAKLEKPAAIDHLDEIIEQSDGIMVARGDLGVEMPPEAVPPLQKRILAACRVARAAGDRRHPDARIRWSIRRRRRAPRPRTWRPRSMTAPTR